TVECDGRLGLRAIADAQHARAPSPGLHVGVTCGGTPARLDHSGTQHCLAPVAATDAVDALAHPDRHIERVEVLPDHHGPSGAGEPQRLEVEVPLHRVGLTDNVVDGHVDVRDNPELLP